MNLPRKDKPSSKEKTNVIYKKYLLQKGVLLLGRKLLMVSPNKRRHIKKGTVPLLHLLILLQKLFPLIRSYFSSSPKLALKKYRLNKSLQ